MAVPPAMPFLRAQLGDGCKTVVTSSMHDQTLVLKSDPAAALVDLLGQVAKARGSAARTVLEHSPVKDSSSNGFIEAGVRSVEGLVRTIWIGLLRRLGEKIEVTHPISHG